MGVIVEWGQSFSWEDERFWRWMVVVVAPQHEYA